MAATIIDTAQIVDEAITTAKIAPAAIDQSKMQVDSIGSTQIQAGAVGMSELGALAIDTDTLVDGAVTAPKLDTDAVTTIKIKDDAITTVKISDETVTEDKLSLESIPNFTRDNPYFYDNFVGASLTNRWAVSGDAGGSILLGTGFGIAILTNNTINDVFRVNFNGVLNFRMGQLPIFSTRVGFTSLVNRKYETGLSVDATAYLFFRYDSSVSPNWFAVSRNGGAETAADTGIPVTTSFVDLEIKYISSTLVEFKIAGVLVATNVTNNPASTGNFEPWMEITTLQAIAGNARIDFILVDYDRFG